MQTTDHICIGCMKDNKGQRVCPHCGYDADAPREKNCLPARSLLARRYLVGRVLAVSAQAVTYLGWDSRSNAAVRIHEFFSPALCGRREDGSVHPLPDRQEAFAEGLRVFLSFAVRLERFQTLTSLLCVRDVAEDFGTAYYVTDAASGISLRVFLLRNGGMLQWEQAKPLFLPLIGTLRTLHENGVCHYGISPDSLLVTRQGKLLLSGLQPEIEGAGDTAVLPGYSAPEQYDGGPKGPFTDVYSLCATLYRTLVGTPPTAADERRGAVAIPTKIAGSLPVHVLRAIAGGLQLDAEKRIPTMRALYEQLVGGRQAGTPEETDASLTQIICAPKPAPGTSPPPKPQPSKPAKKTRLTDGQRYALFAVAGSALLLFVILIVLYFKVFAEPAIQPAEDGTSQTVSVSSVEAPPETSAPSAPSETLYTVPTLTGQTYLRLRENGAGQFAFELEGKAYTDKAERGMVFDQTPAANTQAPKGTVIRVKVSLGPEQIAVPNLSGLSKSDATIVLLELGFEKQNIIFVDKIDETAATGMVVGSTPSHGDTISPEDVIHVYLNSYVPRAQTNSALS